MPQQRRLPQLDSLPRTVYARSESLPAGSLAPAHSHAFGQLSFAGEGVLTVATPTGSHVAPPRRAVWLPPGLVHEVTTSQPAEMRSLYIRADQDIFCPPRCLVLTVGPLARELILAAAALPPEYDEEGPDGRLVAVLLDQLATLPVAGFSLPWPADPQLAAVCRALAAAPDDARPMETIAKGAGMTGRTLARRFQSETGLSFGKWRRRQRLLAALAHLEAGASVTSAGLESGYESASAFVAAFREAFGSTPGEFARGRRAGPGATAQAAGKHPCPS
ncbi:helix-turn-helix transcriptional regulator [Desulfovibrio sp. DV]|uniref:AraC family transcriptional regulator n=1 Tax=Desulfovibrio sp. DV TaxID=1844708 RepID=UPI00094B7D5E|nr:helix-turn-helix transcriptional regulator [Desulfovibrio sp. DV]